MKSKSIKESLPALVRTIMLLLLILIIPVHIWFELQVRHQSQEESAKEIFGQLEQVIVNNKQDILLQKEEHSLSCIQAAEIAAHFLRSDPEIPYSIEKTKQLAEKLDVDELHFLILREKFMQVPIQSTMDFVLTQESKCPSFCRC